MNKVLLVLAVLLLVLGASAQSQGFYHAFSDPDSKTWRVTGMVETESQYLLMFSERSESKDKSKLMALSLDGEIIGEEEIVAQDTAVTMCDLFLYPNDGRFVVGLGICVPPDDNALLLMLCFDVELNVVGRSLVPLPRPSHSDYYLFDYKFMQAEEGYFAALTFRGLPSENEILLCKISNEGHVTRIAELGDSSVTYVDNLFHVHDSPNCFGVFAAKQIPSLHVTSCVLVYDGDLQLKKSCNITNIYEDDGDGNVYGANIKPFNSMICPSPYGGYIVSSRLNEYTIQTNDQSAFFAKTDSNYVIQSQYHVIGHFNDTTEAPAFYRSVDVDNNGNVYQCSMQNIHYDSWPYGSNGTHLLVTKADSDLNVIWQKRFLKDGNIYSAFHTMSTSDRGCMIVGNVYDHNPEQRQDIFVLKINTDGFVGVEEIQEKALVTVYPNPAKESIKIDGVEAAKTLVYDIHGQFVFCFFGNEADLKLLPAGIYLLQIVDRDGYSHFLRLFRME